MNLTSRLGVGIFVLASSAAWGQNRVWVLPIARLDNSAIMTEMPTGGYSSPAYAYAQNGHYWWANTPDGVARAWYRFRADPNGAYRGGPTFDPAFTTEDPPAEPRLYKIDTWVPPAHCSTFNIIKVDILGDSVPDASRDIRVPWGGAFGTNAQWLDRKCSNDGTWKAAGFGPQAPLSNGTAIDSSACTASNSGNTMWLRKGDWLFIYWNFIPGTNELGVSFIRITEVNTVPPGGFAPVLTCGSQVPACGGAIDLRCIGNADPLFGVGASPWWDSPDSEPMAQQRSESKEYGLDDWSLAADGYRHPCFTTETPVTSGLPASGAYTAHLASGDVNFQLRYEGRNSLKWDSGTTNPTDPFYKDRVFTLNAAIATEFTVKPYNKLYLLSMKNGGDNGVVNAHLVYSDNSSTTQSAPLYDAFRDATNRPGDGNGTTSIAVGVGGFPRNNGAILGFKRIKGNDDAPLNGALEFNGGGTDGAYFFVHTLDVDPSKSLSQVQLSITSVNPITVSGANWQDNPRRIVAGGAFTSYTWHDGDQFTITAGNGGAKLQRFGIKSKVDDSTIELYDDINDNCNAPFNSGDCQTGCSICDGSISGVTGMGGNVVVFAATLVSPYHAFDATGPGGFPDGIADMNDFGLFQRCYSGGTAAFDPARCSCFDHDKNGTIGGWACDGTAGCAVCQPSPTCQAPHIQADTDLQSFMNCVLPGANPAPAGSNCD